MTFHYGYTPCVVGTVINMRGTRWMVVSVEQIEPFRRVYTVRRVNGKATYTIRHDHGYMSSPVRA